MVRSHSLDLTLFKRCVHEIDTNIKHLTKETQMHYKRYSFYSSSSCWDQHSCRFCSHAVIYCQRKIV